MRIHRGAPTWLASVLVVLVASAPGAPASAQSSYTLPAPDLHLQQGLTGILNEAPFRSLIDARRLSVALVDITDIDNVRYAGYDADRMRYAASLPKIGILLGVFDQVGQGRIRYTPELRGRLELMIRNSDNKTSSDMIRLVGFQNIARTLQDPRYLLYDRDRRGGIWVGRGFGSGVGLWRRDPIASISHGATARQAARFFVLLERGELVSPWASAEMKSILSEPRIHHKFVLGLENAHPDSEMYRKSGTWQNYHADAMLVERAGRTYVAVALLESPTTSSQGVLASLIVRLDQLVFDGAGAPADF
jgi:beta-lactamase class A